MILQHKIFKSVYLPFRYITFKSCSYEGWFKGILKGRKFRFSDPKTPGCWIWEKSTKYQKTANSLELMTVFSCHNGCASFCIIMLSNSKWHFWFFCNFQAKCCLQNKHAEHFLNLMSSAEVNCIAGSVLWWSRDGWLLLMVLHRCEPQIVFFLPSAWADCSCAVSIYCCAVENEAKPSYFAAFQQKWQWDKAELLCCCSWSSALLQWPEDGCHTTGCEHQLRTDLLKGTEPLLLCASPPSGRERGKTKKVLLNSFCCGLL